MILQFVGGPWKGAVQQLTCIQIFPLASNDVVAILVVITGTQTPADVTIYKQHIPLSKENKIYFASKEVSLASSFFLMYLYVSINKYNGIEPRKEKRNKLFTYSKTCTCKELSPHEAKTCSSFQLEIAPINIPLLDVIVLK